MRWTVHLDGGPRRVNHAAVALKNDQYIFSFGGYTSGDNYEVRRPLDVHILDTYTYRWHANPVPASIFDEQYSSTPYQRYGHTVVDYRNSAFLWGGRNDSDGGCDKLFQFDPNAGPNAAWSKVPCRGAPPPKRDGHSACVYNDKMIVFGGYEEEFQRFSCETFTLDFRNFQWQRMNTEGFPPPWRDFHTATIIDNNRMYVFGGRSDFAGQYLSNREVYDDKLRFLDLSENRWYVAPVGDSTTAHSTVTNPAQLNRNANRLCQHRPPGRRSQSSWCYNGDLYIFGGYNGHTKEHYNDLYRYNVASSTWQKLEPFGTGPEPRRRQCCVLVGSRVFLFGGTSPICETVYVDDDEMTEKHLIDHSDLFVLDMQPNLKTLCMTSLIDNGFHNEDQVLACLPVDIKMDLAAMTTPNVISPIRSNNNG